VIGSLVESAAERWSSAPALRCSDGAWSYRELHEAAARLVAEHADWREQRIGVACSQAPRQLAILVALDRLGAAAFLFPASLSPTARDAARDQYGLAAIVTDDAQLPGAATPTPGDSGTVVLFTSGTSGPPKPAVHTWESLAAAVSRHPRNEGRRWLLAYDLARFAGMQVLLQALATGGALCVPASREPSDVVACLTRDQVEYASGTPTFWRMLLGAATAEELAACTLEQITLGGEAVDQGVLDRLRAAFPTARISHIYASTEMGTCFVVNDGRAGFPAAYLADSSLPTRLRIGDDGELWIASRRAMKEYLGEQPSGPADWFATGDMVRLDGDRVYFVGRRSECINVGGAKVYPADVERVIRTVDGVREVRVHPIASSMVGQLVGAEVEPIAGRSPDEVRVAVLSVCRRDLVKYQVPAVVKMVERLTINDAGKIARGGA
jgi:acyl-CoA synthetase (AMP-forming)/AMP-acid ligase II